MQQLIVAETIKPGMIIRTATDARFDVERVVMTGHGVVRIYNYNGDRRSLDGWSAVTLLGYFNV